MDNPCAMILGIIGIGGFIAAVAIQTIAMMRSLKVWDDEQEGRDD